MNAAMYNHPDAIKQLLKLNAYVDLANKRNETALIIAADHGHTPIVKILLKNNAYVDAQDEWLITALMKATYKSDLATVKMLLRGKANPAIKDLQGSTACSYATNNNVNDLLLALMNYKSYAKQGLTTDNDNVQDECVIC